MASVTDPYQAKAISQDQRTGYATVTYSVAQPAVTDADRDALFAAGRGAQSAGLEVEFGGTAVTGAGESSAATEGRGHRRGRGGGGRAGPGRRDGRVRGRARRPPTKRRERWKSALDAVTVLAAGALVLFAGDAIHSHLSRQERIELHSPWQFICWITADALLAAAALEKLRPAGPAPRAPRSNLRMSRHLSFLAVVVAHALMLAAAVQEGEFFPWGGLALGGATLSGLVLFRQTLVQRESDEQAVTDHLTGLANRSLFRATSNRALARDARTGRHSAVLVLDMNGFKEVNDSLGHKLAPHTRWAAWQESFEHLARTTDLPAAA